MTAVLERVPVERITLEARQIRFGRTLLSFIAFLFFAVGWTLSKVWLALVWCAVAVKVGWAEARAGKPTGGS